MAKSTPPNLKLHPGEPLPAEQPDLGELACVTEACQAFARATGWTLRFVGAPAPNAGGIDGCWPLNFEPERPAGHLRLERTASRPASASGRVEWDAACQLASAIAGILSELGQTRAKLWQREAELAAGVPVVPRADEREHVAVRLQAILKSCIQAVGCDAAGVYMLDVDTTHLKLRASWGLPFDRLQEPARPLATALADLEALAGQMVVRESVRDADPWNPPEEFSSWVCVPISSATVVLGTLWVFCDRARPFTQPQTDLLEIVAGRIASELDREMLLAENVQVTRFKRQLEAAACWRQDRSPRVTPHLEGWDLAGWTNGDEVLAGDFYDWIILPKENLALVVGDPHPSGLTGTLSAARLQATVQANVRMAKTVDAAVRRTNHLYCSTSPGDDAASLFVGLLDSASGRLSLSTAGDIEIIVLRDGDWRSLSRPQLPLGLERSAEFGEQRFEINPGDVLVIVTDGVRETLDSQGRMLGAAGIAQALLPHLNQSAKELADCLHAAVTAHQASAAHGQAALVLKRIPASFDATAAGGVHSSG